ncbi:laminin subunit beta-3-like [Polymixia lowei]
MRILLLVAAIAAVSSAQTDCSRGACYPPSEDLLQGRGHLLQASSTCGLTGSEVFCTPYQQWKMKCCPCDSRNPSSTLAHTVQDALSTAGPNRWWQSKKGVDQVSLQVDLQNLFQLDNLVLSFKGPRPDAFVVERTLDNGKTWQPSIYMASDCHSAFPGVPTRTPRTLEETYCYTLPSTVHSPYRDHTVEFNPLRQYYYAPQPNGQKIQGVSGLTGLRVRLTNLGEVPRPPGRALSKFYALREMKVMGSCMCHGHANRCLPETSPNQLTSTQVSPQCECQHNTAGVNCERCADLFNDLPWRPAEERNTHTCQRCECNNHAQRCHFDQAVYEASGRRSGGVCEGCMHHTTGPKCDRCAPGYQPNPRSRMDRPDACTRCSCDADGAANGDQCDESTGLCQCKANVEGPRCDRCKMGYYGLSGSNPLGCTKCSCSPDGSRSSVCDPATGQCPCRAHFHGLACQVCSQGYWKPYWAKDCRPCGCDPTQSVGGTCDQLTGMCQCRPGFGGHNCTDCPDNTYGDPLIGCQPCQCSTAGMVPGGCDKTTGACHCSPGVTGARCDSCSRGHCDSFPTCEICPSCFFSLDEQLRNLNLGLERLSQSLPSPPVGTGGSGNIGPRIRALEARLNQIRDSISLPPNSARQIDSVLSQLSKFRDQMEQANDNLSPLEQPDLGSELDKLQTILDGLSLEYNAKKDALRNSSASNSGAFFGIKNAYDESTDAAKSVEASGKTVDQSAAVRGDTMDLQNQVQPGNTRDLDNLNQHLASRPDLTPVAKQVCGSVRTAPCTPLRCQGGELCPAEGAPPCGRGENCVGALPLGKRAVDDTMEVKDRVEKLSGKITQAAEQLQETQETTNEVRKSVEKLSGQMKQARDDLEGDLKETRDVVKAVKDFLSDPSSNLNHIQEVSDWILNAKLPLSLSALKRKLEELKNLAAGLPDSAAVLNQAGPQLATARRLLQEAQDARDAALGIKADVDGLLEGFGSVEGSLSGLEERLQNSMDEIDELNGNLNKAKAQLTPAEEILGEVSDLTGRMKPQLSGLKDLLLAGGQLAQGAAEQAGEAKREADAAEEDLMSLEKQLKRLRAVEATSGRGDGAGSTGERLRRLKEEAGSLAKDTGDMMNALAGKADSLRRLQGEVLKKSEKLEGLDAKLQRLVATMREKAHNYARCQG